MGGCRKKKSMSGKWRSGSGRAMYAIGVSVGIESDDGLVSCYQDPIDKLILEYYKLINEDVLNSIREIVELMVENKIGELIDLCTLQYILELSGKLHNLKHNFLNKLEHMNGSSNYNSVTIILEYITFIFKIIDICSLYVKKVTSLVELEAAKDRNSVCCAILQDRAALLALINRPSLNITIAEVSASQSVAPILKPEYQIYIELYGWPTETFDTNKLQNIINAL
jgi:hypothetical protein